MRKVTLSDLKLSVEWAREQSEEADRNVANYKAIGDIDAIVKHKDRLTLIADKRYNVLQTVLEVYKEAADKLLEEIAERK